MIERPGPQRFLSIEHLVKIHLLLYMDRRIVLLLRRKLEFEKHVFFESLKRKFLPPFSLRSEKIVVWEWRIDYNDLISHEVEEISDPQSNRNALHSGGVEYGVNGTFKTFDRRGISVTTCKDRSVFVARPATNVNPSSKIGEQSRNGRMKVENV